jgi:hypothetical protein
MPAQFAASQTSPVETAAVANRSAALTLGISVNAQVPIDYFQDGLLVVRSGAGAGELYGVSGNTKVEAVDSTITVHLDAPVNTTIPAGSVVTLYRNAYNGVEISNADSDAATPIVGATPVAVTASYYFWVATNGPSVVLQQGQLDNGDPFNKSKITNGAVAISRQPGPPTDYVGQPYGEPGRLVVRRSMFDTDVEALVPFSGPAVVPTIPLGYVLENATDGQLCLVYMGLDN